MKMNGSSGLIPGAARVLRDACGAWRSGGLTGLGSVMRRIPGRVLRRFADAWISWWMRRASLTPMGRTAIRIARWAILPYNRAYYADGLAIALLSPFGYVDPSACVNHNAVQLGPHAAIWGHVRILQWPDGGAVEIGSYTYIGPHCLLTTQGGGSIRMDRGVVVGHHCELMAFKANILIGPSVLIGSYCSLYPYDHGIAAHEPIWRQPFTTKGDIIIEEGAWIGTRVVILSGVRIGKGAVVGAGSVVTKDVPADAVVVGNPARIVKFRTGAAVQDIHIDCRHDALIVRSADGTIKEWDEGATQLYGWNAIETVGKLSHRVLKTIFPYPLQSIEEELLQKGLWEGLLIHTCQDGSHIVVHSRWQLHCEEEIPNPIIFEINSQNAVRG